VVLVAVDKTKEVLEAQRGFLVKVLLAVMALMVVTMQLALVVVQVVLAKAPMVAIHL
jgi:hypothetical protein